MKKLSEIDIENILSSGDFLFRQENVLDVFIVDGKSAIEKLDRLRDAIREHQAFQFVENGQADWMDVQTANVIINTVIAFSKRRPEELEKFCSLSFRDMARISWRCIA